MTADRDIHYVLSDCFLALGQGVGTDKHVGFDTIAWWHSRYEVAFTHAIRGKGNSWAADRRRVTAVGRYLGIQAKAHAGESHTIDQHAAHAASVEIERGCQMNAQREAYNDDRCPTPAVRS